MHVLNLPTAQRDYLNRFGAGAMNWRVIFYAKTYKITGVVDGIPVIDYTEQVETAFEVQNYILNSDIILNQSIPALPTKGGIGKSPQTTNLDLQISNPLKIFGSVQDGGIFENGKIKDGRVEIYLTFSGTVPDFLFFKGRLVSISKESNGSSIFSFRDSLWDIIDNTTLYANAGDGRVDGAVYYIDNSGFAVDIPIQYTPTPPSDNFRLTIHHPITSFDENGNIQDNVTGGDPTKINLKRLDFYFPTAQKIPLGKYTIKFTSATDFYLVSPDQIRTIGNIGTSFSNDYIYIDSTDWDVVSDPTGVEFSFFASYTVSGNPISIVKDMIVRSLTEVWNGSTPIAQTSPLIDWATFDRLEEIWKSETLYVSEFSQDNEIFNPLNAKKPTSVKAYAQKVLDHIGAQLTFDNLGRITISSGWVQDGGGDLWQIGSLHCETHEISQGIPYDFMRLMYGYNRLTNNYGSRYLIGSIPSAGEKANVYDTGFEYYKSVVSQVSIEDRAGRYLWEHAQRAHVTLSFTIAPNFGVTLSAGDRFIAEFETQPILPNRNGTGKYWQIISVSKGRKKVTVEAIEIPEPVRADYLCQSFIICFSKLL